MTSDWTVPAGGQWGANYKVQNEKTAGSGEFYTQQKYQSSSTVQTSGHSQAPCMYHQQNLSPREQAESDQARHLAPTEGNYSPRQKS